MGRNVILFIIIFLFALILIIFSTLLLLLLFLILNPPYTPSQSFSTPYKFLELDPITNRTKFGIMKLNQDFINGYISYTDERTGHQIFVFGNEGRPLGTFRRKRKPKKENPEPKKPSNEESEIQPWEYWRFRSEKPMEYRCHGGCMCNDYLDPLEATLLPIRFVFVWAHSEEDADVEAEKTLAEMCSVTYGIPYGKCPPDLVYAEIDDCHDWIELQENFKWYEEMERRYQEWGKEQSRILLEKRRDERLQKEKEEKERKKVNEVEKEVEEKNKYFCLGHCLDLKEAFVGLDGCRGFEVSGKVDIESSEGRSQAQEMFSRKMLGSFCRSQYPISRRSEIPCVGKKKEWGSSNILCVPR